MTAPVCFGAATVFTHDSNVCAQCPHFAGCGEEVTNTLKVIQAHVDVDALLKRHQKAREKTVKTLRKADERREATLPPGNSERSLPEPTRLVAEPTTLKVTVAETDDGMPQFTAKLKGETMEFVKLMFSKGYAKRVPLDFASGKNTFETIGPLYMREAVAMLLAKGEFLFAELRDRYVDVFKWPKNAADTRAIYAAKALVAIGLVKEEAGRFMVTPKTT